MGFSGTKPIDYYFKYRLILLLLITSLFPEILVLETVFNI